MISKFSLHIRKGLGLIIGTDFFYDTYSPGQVYFPSMDVGVDQFAERFTKDLAESMTKEAFVCSGERHLTPGKRDVVCLCLTHLHALTKHSSH